MKQHKILFVQPYASEASGADESLFYFLDALNRQQVHIAMPRDNPYEARYRSLGANIHFIKLDRIERALSLSDYVLFTFRFLSAAIQLFRLIKEQKINLVHINAATSISSAIAAKMAKIPLVYHIRMIPHSMSRFQKIYMQFTGYLANRIITISEATRKMYSKAAPRHTNKLKVIYNCINADSFAATANGNLVSKEFGFDESTFVVGCVARLIPWKGQRYFLQAAKDLASKYPNIKFLIVGDIPSPKYISYKEELKTLVVKFGIKDKVIFTGNRKDIKNVISALNILVLPSGSASQQEAFGRVLIEAMCLGKAVVATAQGGIPEIVEDGKTGILVPPQDPVALGEAIEYLYERKEEILQMGQRGRERVETLFSCEKSVRQLEEVYCELIELSK